MSLEFLLTSLLVVASPGTGVVYTIAAGLAQGWRASLIAAFGCTLGCAPHALAAVSGLAALSDVLSQGLVQLSVPNEMRGRAMGSWMLAIGTAPVGHLQMGALASGVGVSRSSTVRWIGIGSTRCTSSGEGCACAAGATAERTTAGRQSAHPRPKP